MLKIYVAPRKEQLITADGREMTVFKASIHYPENETRLNDNLHMGVVAEVGIQIDSGEGDYEEIELPDNLHRGICEFITRYHGRQNLEFSCYQFVTLVCSMPEHTVLHLLAQWNLKPVAERSVGDVLFLLDTEQCLFRHAAIYLGYGVYISVYGAGGDLEFSTCEDMRIQFGGTAVSAVPRAATS